MFTGLVSAVAQRRVAPTSGAAGAVLAVERPPALRTTSPSGRASPSPGVCLTVVPPGGPGQRCRSTSRPRRSRARRSGASPPGARVNLERALAAGDRLGGHVVAGHVDGTAEVLGVATSGDSWTFPFSLPARARALRRREGLDRRGRDLADGRRALGRARSTWPSFRTRSRRRRSATEEPGDRVNVEVDVLGKYVERLLAARLGEAPDADARDERLRSSWPKARDRRRPPAGRDPAPGAYVHVPFCAHRCTYCSFVALEGRGRRGRFL